MKELTIKKKYKGFSPDIDTKAVQSKLRFQREWHEEKLRSLKENVQLKNKKVLDLGCGSGGLTFKLSKIEGIRILGVDFNEEAIMFANSRKKKEHINNLQFLSSSAENLRFKKNYFDVIVAFDVLDHLYDYKKALKNMHSLLKKGGSLFLTVENKNSLWPVVEKVWDIFGNGRNYSETHLTHFSKSAIKGSLKQAGFSVDKIFTIHNISTFFYLLSDFYPKKIDDMIKNKGWGLTIAIKAVKS